MKNYVLNEKLFILFLLRLIHKSWTGVRMLDEKDYRGG